MTRNPTAESAEVEARTRAVQPANGTDYSTPTHRAQRIAIALDVWDKVKHGRL